MNFIFASCLIMAIAVVGALSERSERICEPGGLRMSECGPCTCNNDGTQEECENVSCHGSLGTGKRIVRASRYGCIPGEVFKMECNTCRCLSNGDPNRAMCTAMACR